MPVRHAVEARRKSAELSLVFVTRAHHEEDPTRHSIVELWRRSDTLRHPP